MTLRRKAREFALQMLFQWEVGSHDPARVEASFWKSTRAEKKTRDFANRLFEETVAAEKELDRLIEKHAENWRLDRMSAIDRNILRLAAYELRAGDNPPKVVINEAVELAKKFSSEDSAPFINGILDAVRKTLAKS
jgi:N utilization substance protein B